MTEAELREMRERLEAVTAGPWEYQGSLGENCDSHVVFGPPGSGESLHGIHRNGGKYQNQYGPIAVTSDGEYVESHRAEADAEFIANARQDIPALLTEVERLRAEIVRWRCDSGGAHRWQLTHVGLLCIDCGKGPAVELDND